MPRHFLPQKQIATGICCRKTDNSALSETLRAVVWIGGVHSGVVKGMWKVEYVVVWREKERDTESERDGLV